MTEQLLDWLAEHEVRKVFEIGPGMGLSTQRLATRGWNVVALERDPVLRLRLRGATVVADLEEGLAHGPFDAVFAESVLYNMPLQELFPRLWAALRPGGVLVFCDMLWSRDAIADECARYHDQSLALFGIAMVPREALTWTKMSEYLHEAGFEVERQLNFHLDPASSKISFRCGQVLAALVRRPRLAVDWLRHRHRMKLLLRPPEHWLENWAAMAVKQPECKDRKA